MHFDDLIAKKKLILEKNLPVNFKSRIKAINKQKEIDEKLAVQENEVQQVRTLSKIKNVK